MTIFAFGDDHVRAAFSGCNHVSLYWLGPYTMGRMGRGGAFRTLEIAMAQADDTLIYMFGGEDVRRHIVRDAQSQYRNISDLAHECAANFVDAIVLNNSILGFSLKYCVVGVLPPAHAQDDLAELPALGTFHDRRIARNCVNGFLKAKCLANGIAFIDTPKAYEARDGSLRSRVSDGRGHVAACHAHHLCRAVERAMAVDLGYRRIWRSRAASISDAAAFPKVSLSAELKRLPSTLRRGRT